MVLFFVVDRSLFGFLLIGFFCLRTPQSPVKKKKQTHENTIRQGVDRDAQSTCAKSQGRSLEKGVNVWACCAENKSIRGVALSLLTV